jgi:hypothetical protein
MTPDIKVAVQESRDCNNAQSQKEKQSQRINCKIFKKSAPVIITGEYCKTGLKYSENNYENVVDNIVPVSKNQS